MKSKNIIIIGVLGSFCIYNQYFNNIESVTELQIDKMDNEKFLLELENNKNLLLKIKDQNFEIDQLTRENNELKNMTILQQLKTTNNHVDDNKLQIIKKNNMELKAKVNKLCLLESKNCNLELENKELHMCKICINEKNDKITQLEEDKEKLEVDNNKLVEDKEKLEEDNNKLVEDKEKFDNQLLEIKNHILRLNTQNDDLNILETKTYDIIQLLRENSKEYNLLKEEHDVNLEELKELKKIRQENKNIMKFILDKKKLKLEELIELKDEEIKNKETNVLNTFIESNKNDKLINENKIILLEEINIKNQDEKIALTKKVKILKKILNSYDCDDDDDDIDIDICNRNIMSNHEINSQNDAVSKKNELQDNILNSYMNMSLKK